MASAKDLEGKLVVSTSPHLRGEESIPEIMWTVAAALLPALFVALYVFGVEALVVIAVAVAAALVTESAVQRLLGRQATISDGSAVVTGLLLAFTLPPNVRWYVPFVGALVAIAIAKHCFGGLGNNIFNPALLGRAFVHFAFPSSMNQPSWPMLTARGLKDVFTGSITKVDAATGDLVDAVSRATPLSFLKDHPGVAWSDLPGGYGLKDLFLGTTPGCIGETSAVALLIGGAALIVLRHVNWRLPLAYIGTVAVLVFLLPVPVQEAGGKTVLAGGVAGLARGDLALGESLRLVAAHVMSGGLILGAFFMATDMVTCPITGKGQVIFGIGAGLLVALIRLYGGYPEGVCYSILLMNTATPLIDRHVRPRLFGKRPKEKSS
jgi:electron transport complex protein RnfD